MKLDKLIKKTKRNIEIVCAEKGKFSPRIYMDYKDLFNDDDPIKESIQDMLYTIDFNRLDPCLNQNIQSQHTQLVNKKIPHIVAALAQFAGYGKGPEAEKAGKAKYREEGNLEGFEGMIHVMSIRVFDGTNCNLLMNKINDYGKLTKWEFCTDNYENIYK